MSIFNEKINSVTLASKDGYKPSDALNKFLIGSNGFFKQVESDIVIIRHKVDSVPELQNLQEGATVKIEKIPFKLFLKIRMFFKKIYQEFKTESTICVMQDLNTKEYSLFVPDQKNASTTSNYKLGESPRFLEELKTKKLIMVCHSHPWPSTSTGPSGTDNNDEKEPILYMILSNVEKIPVYYLSTCDGNQRVQIPFFHVWENPIATIFTTAESNAEDKNIVAKLFAKLNVADILETCVVDVDIPYDEWKGFTSTVTYTSTYGSANHGSAWWQNSNYRGAYMDDDHEYYNWNNVQGYRTTERDARAKSFEKKTKSGILIPATTVHPADKKKQTTIEDEYAFVLKSSSEEIKQDLESGKYTFEQIHEMYERLQETYLDDESDNDETPTWGMTEEAEDILDELFQETISYTREQQLIEVFLDEHLNRDICFEIDLSDVSPKDKKAICFHYFKTAFQYSYEFSELSNIEKVLGIFQYIDSNSDQSVALCFKNFVAAYEAMAEFYVGMSLDEDEARKIVERFDLDTVYAKIERIEMLGDV